MGNILKRAVIDEETNLHLLKLICIERMAP
jgi:hypothetical protein